MGGDIQGEEYIGELSYRASQLLWLLVIHVDAHSLLKSPLVLEEYSE